MGQECQNKNTFNDLEANLDEFSLSKKKSPNLPLNTEIFDIYRNFKISLVAGNGRRPVERRPERAV